MEKMLEQIKCACPHECSNDCIFCKTEYDFIIEKPIALKCSHCICNKCEAEIKKNKNLKCEICKLKKEDKIIEVEQVIPKTLKSLFDTVLEINLETCNQKLKSKLINLEDDVNRMENQVSKLRQTTKNDIDRRVEILKDQIDSEKSKLYQEIDSICDEYLK